MNWTELKFSVCYMNRNLNFVAKTKIKLWIRQIKILSFKNCSQRHVNSKYEDEQNKISIIIFFMLMLMLKLMPLLKIFWSKHIGVGTRRVSAMVALAVLTQKFQVWIPDGMTSVMRKISNHCQLHEANEI